MISRKTKSCKEVLSRRSSDPLDSVEQEENGEKSRLFLKLIFNVEGLLFICEVISENLSDDAMAEFRQK